MYRAGYIEQQNFVLDRHSAQGLSEHFDELASLVVTTNPDLIFVFSVRLAHAFKAATAKIPIVAFTNDPVVEGLAPNLHHPGGNITGVVTVSGISVWDKQLEYLKETVPGAARIA